VCSVAGGGAGRMGRMGGVSLGSGGGRALGEEKRIVNWPKNKLNQNRTTKAPMDTREAQAIIGGTG